MTAGWPISGREIRGRGRFCRWFMGHDDVVGFVRVEQKEEKRVVPVRCSVLVFASRLLKARPAGGGGSGEFSRCRGRPSHRSAQWWFL